MIFSPRGMIIILVLLLILIVITTQEGDDREDQKQTAIPDKEKGGAVVTLQGVGISPQAPNPQSVLRATVQTHPPDSESVSYRYLWRVNQKEAGTGQLLRPGPFRLGDIVSVEVTLIDKETAKAVSSPMAASMQMGNRPPVLTQIELSPIPVYAGNPIRVEPTATDGDADLIQFSYQWQINGSFVDGNDQDILSGEQVKSADQILVVVTPSDAYGKGEPKNSSILTVVNRPPQISSIPPKGGKEPKYFYQIVANDPDLDSLKYTLLKGPSGMVGDALSGLVTWEAVSVSEDQTDVELEVSDGKGSRVTQQFKLIVRAVQ